MVLVYCGGFVYNEIKLHLVLVSLESSTCSTLRLRFQVNQENNAHAS
jgi:hypothetical protein